MADLSLQSFTTPQVIDPITGATANVFTQPDQFIQSATMSKNKTQKLFHLRNINSPEGDIEEQYNQAKLDVLNTGGDDHIEDEILGYAAGQEQAALEAAMAVNINNPESIQVSADILANLDVFRARFEDPDAYQQVVQEAHAPESLASIRARDASVHSLAYGLLDELNESNDLLDSTTNVIGLFGVDYIKDVSDTFGEGPIGSLEAFSTFARNFQMRDPEEKAILIEAIVPKLWETFDGNGMKVAAAIEVLFSEGHSNYEIAYGVIFDVINAGDIAGLLRAGRAVLASRSLSKRIVDADGIESAANLQAAAGSKDGKIAEAVGTTKQDAAHSANAFGTGLIDEGTSIDGLAGEIAIATKRSIKIVEEELLPISANTLPKATAKALRREKTQLEQQLVQLKGTKDKDFIDNVQKKLEGIQAQIKAGRQAAKAEADLSRLQQGVIPARFKKQFDVAVEREIALIRQKKPTAKKETPSVKEEADEALDAMGVTIPKAAVTKLQVESLVDDIIKIEPLSPEETTLAISRAQETLTKELNEAGQSINSIDVIKQDKDGVTLQYRTTSGEGERVLKFTRDDVGSFVSENFDVDLVQRWQNSFSKLFTPELLTEQIAPTLVSTATSIGRQAARLQQGLAKVWKETEVGLTKKENYQVHSILQAGDEEGAVFTIAAMREGGIETLNGNIKLSLKQIESYYQKRAFYDALHDIRSLVIHDELEFLGYKNLNYVSNGESKQLIGRVRGNFDLSGVSSSKERIFFPEDGSFRDVNATILNSKKLKEEGYEVVELFETKLLKNNKEAKIALVKRDARWSNLPDKILNYKIGYTPRIYRKGMTYVRDMDSGEVLYAFETRAEAIDFKKEIGGNTRVLADREFNAAGKLLEDSKAFGGLYTGARKSRPLMVKKGDKEYRPERMSTGDSTERYIQNISTIMPLNQYRLATMERWKNTVNQLSEAGRGSGLKEQRFDAEMDLNLDIKGAMEQTRDVIKQAMRMPSREERATERYMLGAANMMQGKPFLADTRRWLLDHSDGNPGDWLKGVTHDLLLGWFNPRQLWVQAQNAVLAISMNPTLALPAMAETLALRSIANLSEAKAKQAAKIMNLSDDTLESLKQYKKSGLLESISTQADFGSVSQGIGKVSMDKVRQLAKTGKIFFNEGENFSRQVSWTMARKKWIKANPKKAIGDKDIIEIAEDATRMLLNMQRENAAWWQTAPVLGNATQFLQVQAKFIENVMPRIMGGTSKWTAAEKARVAGGQMFLYGVVGVPIAEEAISYVAPMFGLTPQEFIEQHPDYTTAINEGFEGTMASLMGADKLAPGTNLNLIGGIFDNNVVADTAKSINAIFNGGYSEQGFVETLTGPSTTAVKRFGDVGANLYRSLGVLYSTPTPDVAVGAILANVETVAALTSTWTQARKLVWLKATGKLMSSRGSVIATSQEMGELSIQEELGMAMGIVTDVERDYYKVKPENRKIKTYKRDLTKDLIRTQTKFLTYGNKALFDAEKAFLMSPLSPIEIMDANNVLIDDVFNATSGAAKELQTHQNAYFKSGGNIPTSTAQSLLSERIK